MAEAAGLTLGAIGLAALFKTCIDCFEYFQDGRYFKNDFDHLSVQLDLVELRFLLWGRSIESTYRSKQQTVLGQNQIARIKRALLMIQNTLRKARATQENYTQGQGDSAAKPPIECSLLAMRKSKFELRNKIRRLTHSTQSLRGTRRTLTWAVHGKEDFSDTIMTLSSFVSNLEQISRTVHVLEAQQVSFRKK
jgi:hypothetical protein